MPESRFDFLLPGGAAKEVPHRAAMESAFGEDFSTVRALTGRRAALDLFGAEAAAAGETIAFATERPSKQLVGHELAHVVQQRRNRPAAGAPLAARNAPSERDADRAALVAARGGHAVVSTAPGGAIALSPKIRSTIRRHGRAPPKRRRRSRSIRRCPNRSGAPPLLPATRKIWCACCGASLPPIRCIRLSIRCARSRVGSRKTRRTLHRR